jgi:hypothetical protein
MTQDEFEFNKDLLKKIAVETKDLRSTINMKNADTMSRLNNGQNAAFEIYSL